MNQAPAPGWYPDTLVPGQSRYWDGSAWTEHTAPTAGNVPPLGGGVPFQTMQGGSAPQKNWFLRHPILSGVLALFVVGTIGSAAGGSEGDEKDDSTSAATATDTNDADAGSNASDESDDTDKPDKASEPKVKPKPKPEPEPEFLRVDAGQMLQEFEGNEAAADAKYKGKDLLITGIVEKVDTEFWDEDQYVIQLSGGGQFVLWTVNCNDVSAEEAATVQPKGKITVQGEFDDGGDLGVEIKDCELA